MRMVDEKEAFFFGRRDVYDFFFKFSVKNCCPSNVGWTSATQLDQAQV